MSNNINPSSPLKNDDNDDSSSGKNKLKDRLRQYYWQSIAIISALAGTGVILQPYIASWDKGILAWILCVCAWLIVALIGVIIDIS